MKNRSLLFCLGLISLILSCNSINKDYLIAEGSTITWKAKHNKDTSFPHIGTINIIEGSIEVKNSIPSGGKLIFDMSSLKKKGEGDEWSRKLEEHLKAADFFNITLYPSSAFLIKNYEENHLIGELEILGIKHEINFPVDLTLNESDLHAKGEFNVDLLPFNLESLVKIETLPDEEKMNAPSSVITFEIDLTAFAK